MQELWLNPGSWTHEQWIAFSILGFIVIATFVMIYRLYRIVKGATRKRELPNLRPGRRPGERRR